MGFRGASAWSFDMITYFYFNYQDPVGHYSENFATIRAQWRSTRVRTIQGSNKLHRKYFYSTSLITPWREIKQNNQYSTNKRSLVCSFIFHFWRNQNIRMKFDFFTLFLIYQVFYHLIKFWRLHWEKSHSSVLLNILFVGKVILA